MSQLITGGLDIAMKIPSHQFQQTVAFYRDTVGLKPLDKEGALGFEYGPVRLWVDEDPTISQAEVWLELFTDNFDEAASHLARQGIVRSDAIEPLPEGMRGGWFMNPASIVHMVREPDAW